QLKALNKRDENELKNLITTPAVKYRRPYDVYIVDQCFCTRSGTTRIVMCIIQAINGLYLLDYALTRKDIDPTRVAANGACARE
ncbi:hypothetical protein D0T50_13620, partial [Bacteroides sp. 214]|uniref:hypothetical protein n=1 Tax=Bacteroides sp. 214 TaxID=2302935 RepID=UPI0013D52CC0